MPPLHSANGRYTSHRLAQGPHHASTTVTGAKPPTDSRQRARLKGTPFQTQKIKTAKTKSNTKQHERTDERPDERPDERTDKRTNTKIKIALNEREHERQRRFCTSGVAQYHRRTTPTDDEQARHSPNTETRTPWQGRIQSERRMPYAGNPADQYWLVISLTASWPNGRQQALQTRTTTKGSAHKSLKHEHPAPYIQQIPPRDTSPTVQTAHANQLS